MKKINFLFVLTALLFAFSACQKEDTPNNNNNGGNNSIDYTTDIAGVYSNVDSNGSGYKIFVNKLSNTVVSISIQQFSYGSSYYSTYGTRNSKVMNSKASFTLQEWNDEILCDLDLDPGCNYDYLRYSGYGTLSGNTLAVHIDEKHYSNSGRTSLTGTDQYDYSGTK